VVLFAPQCCRFLVSGFVLHARTHARARWKRVKRELAKTTYIDGAGNGDKLPGRMVVCFNDNTKSVSYFDGY